MGGEDVFIFHPTDSVGYCTDLSLANIHFKGKKHVVRWTERVGEGTRAIEKEENRDRTHFLPYPLNEENYGSGKEEHPHEMAP